MELDPILLSRIQFGMTAGFHYLYPPLTIGLGWLMFIMEVRYFWTGEEIYEQMAKFWTKLFALTFAMGVTTGIVLEFEFGTNWAQFSRFVGDIFGSPLAAEALFAFFLESTFLAVLVFGWDRVSKRVHLLATAMVAVGSTLSAVWIVVANSWMHSPAGFHLVGEGAEMRAEIVSFWAMFFNPTSMPRLAHVLVTAMITGTFFVMSVSAFYILKNRHVDFAKRSFTIALIIGFFSSITILGTGHLQAQIMAEVQPAKLAAFEGHFKTIEGGAPLYLFGIPDVGEERVKFGLPIPGMLSFLAYNDFSKPVTALDAFPREDWPPVVFPFLAFHTMVALGMGFIGMSVLSLFFWWRGTLFEKRWLMWIFVFAVPAPYIANQLGWMATEIGRQPWIVQGLLRTSEAHSPGITGAQVLGSILMFTFIYTILFVLYIYLLNEKIQKGPEPPEGEASAQAGEVA